MPAGQHNSKTIELTLEVSYLKEGEYLVAYCSALDLAAQGITEKEAGKALDELVEIFIEETHKRGTLEKNLLNLDWRLERVPKVIYKPPANNEKASNPLVISKSQTTVYVPVSEF